MSVWEKTSRVGLWQILLFLILLVLGWLSISPLVFWSPDTGLRYLQVREFLDHRWSSAAVDYSARFLDPALQHVPYYRAYIVHDDELFLRVSPFFPLLASFLIPVIQRFGLVLPPVLGGFFCGLAIYRLSRLSGLRHSTLTMWATVLATPVFFYSIEFWDHTFVMAFSLWACYLLAKGLIDNSRISIFIAGVLASIAWVQRPEYMMFTGALFIARFLVSRFQLLSLIPFISGNLLGALPFFAIQYFWIGHPLGVMYAPVLFGYGMPDSYAVVFDSTVLSTRTIIISRFLTYIEARDPVTFLATILCLIGIVFVVFALRTPRWQKKSVLYIGLVVSTLGYMLWLSVVARVHVTGIIPMLALLPFSLAVVQVSERGTAAHIYRFVLTSTLIFTGLMLLIWPAFGGHHWASRYLFPAYPLLVFLAFYTYEHYKQALPELRATLKLSFNILLLISALIQVAGIRLLFQDRARDIDIRDTLSAMPEDLILTNSPFFPSEMASLDTIFLYAEDEEDFERLIPRMWQHDIQMFGVVKVVDLPMPIPDSVGDITIHEVEPFIYRLEGPPQTEAVLQE